MSEQSFEEMLDETFKTIHTGEVVDGTVIDVKEDQIILNIGYKADGIITRNEYSSTPGIDLQLYLLVIQCWLRSLKYTTAKVRYY